VSDWPSKPVNLRRPRERSRLAGWGWLAGLLLGLLAGCTASNRPSGAFTSGDAETIRPLDGAVGQIARVHAQLRFVVVDFRLNTPPEPEQHLAVYRDGQRVAELKAGYIRRDTTVSADILSGEPREADEVRVENLLPAVR